MGKPERKGLIAVQQYSFQGFCPIRETYARSDAPLSTLYETHDEVAEQVILPVQFQQYLEEIFYAWYFIVADRCSYSDYSSYCLIVPTLSGSIIMFTNDPNRVDATGVCTGHAVSWCAILVGAVIAMAVSLALLVLGASFGFATASPWMNQGASAVAVTSGALIWLFIMQWAASAIGGYITGRLRSRWVNTHGDEVFFRDTAHGFATWAVATVLTAILLTGVASSVIGGGAQTIAAAGAVTAVAGSGEKNPGGLSNPVDYYVDSLYHFDTKEPVDPEARKASVRLFTNYILSGDIGADDKIFLVHDVQARSGLSEQDATTRVDALIAKVDIAKAKAKEAADKARKTAALFSIFTFLSFLVGAFAACLAAILGGRRRDFIYV
jgi:hypothetical protein